jgi:hypothetical protein
MSVNVGPGSFAVPAASASAGGYTSTLASSATLTVLTADPSNPRIDIVVAYVDDVGTSSSFGAVEYITGTPAASPSAPAAPASSTILAQLLVPAGTVAITGGMITDTRAYTVAAGGVLPVARNIVTGYPGLLAYDKASGAFYHQGGASASQARVLPFAPVHVGITGGITITTGGTPSAIQAATVTTDGNTDLKVHARVAGITQATGSATGDVALAVQAQIDGVAFAGQMEPCPLLGSGTTLPGFDVTFYTSGGSTPTAGTHVITLAARIGAPGGNTFHTTTIYAGDGGYLRVEPVIL